MSGAALTAEAAGDARAALARAFADRHGYAGIALRPLAQDGSYRRYWRLDPGPDSPGPAPAVLMDAPPPEDVAAFMRIAAHLGAAGLSAPAILAADLPAGLLLLEDFGDAVLSADPAPLPVLFAAAADTLAALQRTPPPPALPAWDAAAMTEAALSPLADWWWPAMHGAPAPAACVAELRAALASMLAPLDRAAPVFVHRDYFAANLMWLPDRAGVRRIGLLDFQTAGRGHPAYDLASLTQDARRDTPPEAAEAAIAAWCAATGTRDRAALDAAVAVCAAQRHLRVAALWVRLARRDGKRHYLAHGPRTWRLLDAALAHDACAPLRAALARWIPPADRRNPPEGAGA